MRELFWSGIFYSFLGWGMEVGFARLTGQRKKDRKCCLVLPLCPVYGLGAVAILLLPEWAAENLALLWFLGGMAATAAEYAMGWFYEKTLGVRFWDYRECRGNWQGRVCPAFGAIWGCLAVALRRWVHPAVRVWMEGLPKGAILAAVVILTADSFLTLTALAARGEMAALRWYDGRGRGKEGSEPLQLLKGLPQEARGQKAAHQREKLL